MKESKPNPLLNTQPLFSKLEPPPLSFEDFIRSDFFFVEHRKHIKKLSEIHRINVKRGFAREHQENTAYAITLYNFVFSPRGRALSYSLHRIRTCLRDCKAPPPPEAGVHAADHRMRVCFTLATALAHRNRDTVRQFFVAGFPTCMNQLIIGSLSTLLLSVLMDHPPTLSEVLVHSYRHSANWFGLTPLLCGVFGLGSDEILESMYKKPYQFITLNAFLGLHRVRFNETISIKKDKPIYILDLICMNIKSKDEETDDIFLRKSMNKTEEVTERNIYLLKQYLRRFPDAVSLSTVCFLVQSNLEISLLLLHHNGNVNQEINGITPIHVAAAEGNLPLCITYAYRGLDINGRDSKGNTPLHYAAKYGNIKCLGFLIRCGGKIDLINEEGYTVLELLHIRNSNEYYGYEKLSDDTLRPRLFDRKKSKTVEIHGTSGRDRIESLARKLGSVQNELEGGIEPFYAIISNGEEIDWSKVVTEEDV
ncbi:Ankyrin repeat domain-containing protein 37 [Astathelohania contejeani]|uniref:Ankyrin repeat domain-containing protein 37 n=1 Tax=Astathelohania contejeani TaxID=164912 RepID=A0ABQ7HVR2_9MICR|nr:Ankyrin repeat domain-containing protein 37 [Thelohania contejeani]